MNARRQIVAALSEDSYGGIATLHDADRAEQLVDAYRAEVLDEVTTWLVKKAREARADGDIAQADAAAVFASKINRGAVRPNNQRMLPNPGGFEADHTYSYGGWTFQCRAIDRQPDGGKPCAVGWIRHAGDQGWTLYAYDLDQWSADWTDITRRGDHQ